MRYKAVVLDMDGTLLNSSLTIEESTIEVLDRFRNLGGKVYLATGRTVDSMKPYYDMLGLDTPAIAYNGAKVINSSGKTICEYYLGEEEVKYLIEVSKKTGVHLNLYQDEKWYVEDSKNEESVLYREISGLVPEEVDYDNLESYFSTKALFIGDKKVLDELKKDLAEKLSGKVDQTSSKPFFLEIMKKGVNKGEAIKKLMESEGVPLEEVIAFGDGLNDAEMLQTVGFGVAMGNSYEELKAVADTVTLDNDSGGIAEILNELM